MVSAALSTAGAAALLITGTILGAVAAAALIGGIRRRAARHPSADSCPAGASRGRIAGGGSTVARLGRGEDRPDPFTTVPLPIVASIHRPRRSQPGPPVVRVAPYAPPVGRLDPPTPGPPTTERNRDDQRCHS